ncbi:MAG: hypothetical protein NZM42_03130 [Gemmatales bacterium]|nr:hypothetical protein [Gemmatales bacterium]
MSHEMLGWLVLAAYLLLLALLILTRRWWTIGDVRGLPDQGQGDQERVGTKHPQAQRQSRFLVKLSESGVCCVYPDGTSRSVAWYDLQRVEIVTTDSGPFGPDVLFVLHGSSTKCIVSQGVEGETQLLERLQQLPGFRNEAVIEAMCCPENQRFLCWERAASVDSQAKAKGEDD